MNVQFVGLFVVGVVTVCGCAPKTKTPNFEPAGAELVGVKDDEAGSLYTVAEYDPAANPSENLAATASRASRLGKHIILEIGGQW